MTKLGLVIAVLCVAGCGGEDPPSCFQAMNSYYGAGCAFQDGNGAVPQSEAVTTCQGLAGDECDAALGGWLICLDSITPAEGCDCSAEQMELLACL
jgi:hypothetical protein